jgi:peptide subunit release factor 1 (eRF1)
MSEYEVESIETKVGSFSTACDISIHMDKVTEMLNEQTSRRWMLVNSSTTTVNGYIVTMLIFER